MATLTVTSAADSGSGTLRQALSDAANGDTIIFDDALEEDGVITILLSSQIELPAKNIAIDGGTHTGNDETLQTRVVLDAQQLDRVLYGSNNAAGLITLNDITFYNGLRSDTGGGGGLILRNGTNQTSSTNNLNYCRFNSCESSVGGGLFVSSNSVNIINNCVFDNCKARTNGGAVGGYSNSRSTFNNCLFDTCEAKYGGGAFLHDTSTNTFNNCDFKNNTATSTSSDIQFDNGTINIINNCAFSQNVITRNLTISTVSSLTTFTGSNAVEKAVFNANSAVAISGNLTFGELSANAGAAVTFSGVDAILAVTTTATIGSATFTAAEGATGYLALPDGTTPPTVGSGVKTATYGAGASDFHAQITSATTASLSWTQTDSDVPVLLEAQESESDTWTTLSTSATSPYTVTDDDIDDLTFRIFDGESFYTAAGSYTFAKFYQVVAGYVPRNNDTTPHSWQTVIKLLTVNEMNENLKPGQDCAILARVYDAFDNDSPLLNLGSNISSVYYTCEKKTKGLYTTEWSPVTGHNNVSAGADCVLSSLQTDDAWDIDNVGYNFLLSPEISTHQLFETAGLYRIKATINPVDGDPITFYKEINVVE